MHRHGVEYFIGEHGAIVAFRQTVESDDAFEQIWYGLSERVASPSAKFTGKLENSVMIGQGIVPFEFTLQVSGQPA